MISNDDLPDAEQSGKGSIEEAGKFPSQSTDNVTVPAKKVSSATPTFTVGTQDKLDGHVDVTVTGVSDGTKVTLPGVKEEKEVKRGKVRLTNDDLPDKQTKGKGSAQENGKLPTEGTSEITIPGKITSAKGAPAIEFRVELPLPLVVPDPEHLTPTEITELVKRVKEANLDKEVKVDDKGNVTVTDKNTGESALLPVEDLTVKDFEPVKPTDKVPVKDKAHLTPEEKKQVEDKVKAKNPGKEVTVGADGTATVTDPTIGISHEIPGTDLVIEFAKGDSSRLEVPGLIITKWTDELGNDLKQPDSKAPSVPGEANEAYEHGEIEGYVFVKTETEGDVVTHVFRKVSPARPTGDGQQGPATPSDDTNRRPDTATPAEVPATQPAEQPSQTVEVPAQLPNEVSETDSSVSQPQAVLPNTGMKADRATGAFGVLSLLGAFGLLFAKKKKDDEEEA